MYIRVYMYIVSFATILKSLLPLPVLSALLIFDDHYHISPCSLLLCLTIASFFFQSYWEIIDIHHYTNLRCITQWSDLHLLRNDRYNSFSQHPSPHTDTMKTLFPCDEDSWDPFSQQPFHSSHSSVCCGHRAVHAAPVPPGDSNLQKPSNPSLPKTPSCILQMHSRLCTSTVVAPSIERNAQTTVGLLLLGICSFSVNAV